jgi:hypothetical protein
LDRRIKEIVADRVLKLVWRHGLTLIFVNHDGWLVESLVLDSIPELIFALTLARFADNVLMPDKSPSMISFGPSSNWLKSNMENFQTPDEADVRTEGPHASARTIVCKTVGKLEDNGENIKRQFGDFSVWVYYSMQSQLAFSTACRCSCLPIIAVLAYNFLSECSVILNYFAH